MAIGQKAEVSDFGEAWGENVEKEAADEFICFESHGSDAVVFFTVFPLECDFAILKCHQAMIGNGDAVSVAADVVEDLSGPSEGRFGVDDPFMFTVSAQELAEGIGIGYGFEFGKELQFSMVESLLEVEEEFLTEQARKDANRQKESIPAGNPSAVVGRQSACRDDAMQVGVMQQCLGPSVEHGKEADFGSEVFRVGSDGAEGFGACPEEDGVDHAFVLKSHGGNFIRDGKDDVIIGNGKQLGHARFEPLCFGQRLTLRAVAVAAGVIRDSLGPALVAHVDVPTQDGSPAGFDGAHGTMLLARHGSAVDLAVLRAALAEDAGHFQCRPSHGNAGG
jgi:hypothetical protein